MGQRKRRFVPKRGGVTLEIQRLHMAHRFPTFSYRRVGGMAVWQGTLRPRESSPLYRVTVRYRLDDVPRVMVTDPPLATDAPHRYPDDGRLCLYWPDEWRWRPDQLLAETILPWTALWLYYYELWLDCGEWLGPSSPHGMNFSKNRGAQGAA